MHAAAAEQIHRMEGFNMKKEDYRILAVDDEAAICKLLSNVLGRAGYAVDTAPSGVQALECFSRHRYHLILMDLKMPQMDGVETLKQIRKRDRRVPVYFITAFQTEFLDRLKALKEDEIDFEIMQKPLDNRDLVEVVDRVIASTYGSEDRGKKK